MANMPRFEGTGQAKIDVIGVGGAGGNAVARMIDAGVAGVEYTVVNTDQQVLANTKAGRQLAIGSAVTRGLGAGGDPAKGRLAAEESYQDVKRLLEGTDMLFITAGMGGGTGTGAAPVVAKIGKELGALTVAVVTKPFNFEGPRRSRIA
jgi:cell division protein FtsZ